MTTNENYIKERKKKITIKPYENSDQLKINKKHFESSYYFFILSYRKCYQPPAKRTSDSVKKALHVQNTRFLQLLGFFVVNFWLTVTETNSLENTCILSLTKAY